ncbi:hypothetical protein [Cellulomonas pakistanensis]|uniref:Uncharacterized protein n=1 Tax=Cellulomonas pakistanensis TaxID=992287 RepID=A0A919P6R2_9CELL|nr:hypothetical protein [Cellulomonas pakistanensis]GIG35106.1 hypothetical protein Cpa01nite_04870 [Cellulomonas pakistanensis]
MTTLWGTVLVVAALAVSVGLGWVAAAGVLRLADRGGRRPRGAPAREGAGPHEPANDEPREYRKGRVNRGASGDANARALGDGPDSDRVRAKLRGGTWIGVLERLAVTGALLAGEPGGVAVVVAVKGLGRYPELRAGDDPAVSERFVIGTLASLVWAAGIGVLGRWLLTR